MKRDKQMEQFMKTIPKPPKRTKEEKIVCKALDHINYAMHVPNKSLVIAHLNYACGLLEALIFRDDKEENEITK